MSDDDKGPRKDDYVARERGADALVRRARVEKGWTQEDLARAMRQHGFRWSQSTVARVEGGQRPMLYTEASALTDLLGIHEGAIWKRIEPPPE